MKAAETKMIMEKLHYYAVIYNAATSDERKMIAWAKMEAIADIANVCGMYVKLVKDNINDKVGVVR